MPATIPSTLQDALGERAAQDMELWIDTLLKERTVPRDEYRQVLSRLDMLEHDVAGLKDEVRQLRTEMNERFDRLNERFERMESQTNERFERLESRMNERFERMESQANERFDRLNERFDTLYERMLVQTRWTVGTIALFGTAVTILLAIAQFKP